MKIVQSFWSGPADGDHTHGNLRFNGGWRSHRIHMYSWALSCITIKKHYENIELYTDRSGYELLIEKMKLPYSSVKICLEGLSEYPKSLFALAKIKTYSLQSEPFMHLDSDVYIWSKLTLGRENVPLIAQNEENDFQHDLNTLNIVKSSFDFVPSAIKKYTGPKRLTSINAGVLGGSDMNFFQEYSEAAFEFLHKNIHCINKLPNPHLFNTILEQVLFYCFAYEKRKHINYVIGAQEKNYFEKLCCFDQTPHSNKYLHIIGDYKRLPSIEHYLMNRLLVESPDTYYYINSIYDSL